MKKNKIPVLFLITVLILMAAIAVLGALYVIAVHYYAAYQTSDPISYADIRPTQYVTFIYDFEGKPLDRLHGDENREYAAIAEIPEHLKNAVIAIEDRRYYTHYGVDLRSVARAVYVNLKARAFIEGASTITQQLVKNNLLKDTSVKLNRKVEEQIIAYKLENDLAAKLGTKQMAKDFILEQYLNSVNMAHGINGVKLASLYYFNKEMSELSLAECASLAAIIKNPVRFSPENSPESNWERAQLILFKMLEEEMISYADYDAAVNENVHALRGGEVPAKDAVIRTYFVDQVINDIARDLMFEKGLDEVSAYKLVYSGGLSIYTTFEPEIQAIVDDAFANSSLFPSKGTEFEVNVTFETEQGRVQLKETVVSEEAAGEFAFSERQRLTGAGYTIIGESVYTTVQPQGAFAIIDYRTGRVPAIGAGRGEKRYNLAFNRATQAKRQPGSCFKVLAAYLPALDLGVLSASDIIKDEPFTVDDYTPNNYDFKFRGGVSVRTAIRDSINVAAVRTLVDVGYTEAFEYLLDLGFTTLVKSREATTKTYTDLGPALALGGITDGVTQLELAAAFGAIANGGVYERPIFYTKVLAHDGTVLLENTLVSEQVMSPETSYILTDMMTEVVTRGTGTQARFSNISVPISGKTGTSTDNRDLSFAGYTPYYAASVWQGYDMPKELDYDKNYHLLLWSSIMERVHVLKGLTSGSFDIPDSMTDKDLGRNVYVPRPPAQRPAPPPVPEPEPTPEPEAVPEPTPSDEAVETPIEAPTETPVDAPIETPVEQAETTESTAPVQNSEPPPEMYDTEQ